MFFILGITDGRKDFEFTQTMICNICSKERRRAVFCAGQERQDIRYSERKQ